ncbi:hypothetical protein SpCBS45565_g06794 [Spizellomyces sp. 'palustris']|nr:hypothetical protein SpCBS45565_g06794 [Spizellomyces sp. 'palustris']
MAASNTASNLVKTVTKFIPPLSNALHKGQAGAFQTSPLVCWLKGEKRLTANILESLGRIAVIGGSEDYTGAPYFASITSLKLASIDLKNQDRVEAEINKIVERVTSMFPRLHVLVVGPGLSRDEIMIETTKRVIVKAKENGMPLVIDADGLYLVQNNPDIIRGYPLAVLTPNANEFTRLCESVNVPCGKEHRDDVAQKLSQAFGNVTILQKGSRDIISNGKDVLICDAEGSPRRCGGQGDLLSGACATFLAWGKNYEAKAWEHPSNPDIDNDFQIRIPLLAAWAAALLTRNCSRAGFAKHGRAMMTTDMIEQVGDVFRSIFEPDQKKAAL